MWRAVNELKLARAQEEARKAGKEGDDAFIKAAYIRMAGLVVEEGEKLEEIVEKVKDEVAKKIRSRRK